MAPAFEQTAEGWLSGLKHRIFTPEDVLNRSVGSNPTPSVFYLT
jgi:hypothetical protein